MRASKAGQDYQEAVKRAEEARRLTLEAREHGEWRAAERAERERQDNEHLALAFYALPTWVRAGLGEPCEDDEASEAEEPPRAPAPAQVDSDSDDSCAGDTVAQFGPTFAVVRPTKLIRCKVCMLTKPASEFTTDERGRVQTVCLRCTETPSPTSAAADADAAIPSRKRQKAAVGPGMRWCTVHQQEHPASAFTSWKLPNGKVYFRGECRDARRQPHSGAR